MTDYKTMYFALFNAVTTAIKRLQDAQRDGEDAYIESDDSMLSMLPNKKGERLESGSEK